jgi:protein SCO1
MRALTIPAIVIAVVLAVAVGITLRSEHHSVISSSNRVILSVSKEAPLRAAPRYELTNQLGDRISSSSFDGKVQLVAFLFPYCTTYCPLIAANLVRIEREIDAAHLAQHVQIVTFNVDPAGSGPAEMRAFMREYGWDPRNLAWQFLTGTPTQVRRVVYNGYMIGYQRESLSEEARYEAMEKAHGTYVPEPTAKNALAEQRHVDYDVVHNDILELVDTRGEIRKLYDDAEKASDTELITDVRALLPSS